MLGENRFLAVFIEVDFDDGVIDDLRHDAFAKLLMDGDIADDPVVDKLFSGGLAKGCYYDFMTSSSFIQKDCVSDNGCTFVRGSSRRLPYKSARNRIGTHTNE